MEDQEINQEKNFEPDMGSQNPDSSRNEQPARRMRRLLSASEEDTIPPYQSGPETPLVPRKAEQAGESETLGWFEPEQEEGLKESSPDGLSDAADGGQAGLESESETRAWYSGEAKTPAQAAETDAGQTVGWHGEDGNPAVGSTQPTKVSQPRSQQPTMIIDRQGRPEGRSPVPPPPMGSTTELPRRVSRVDHEATQVTPAAYQRTSRQPVQQTQTQRTYTPPQKQVSQTVASAAKPSRRNPPAKGGSGNGNPLGCFMKAGIGFLFVLILVGVVALSFGIYKYFSIARNLPDIEGLSEHASQFETTRILDRNGNVLYEILDPNAGRRTYVPLDKISPYVVAATLATEDKDYYKHPGFDPVAIMRAFWQNYTSQEVVSGASTITQQLARNLLFTPEERVQQTAERKAREIVLAAEITRRYSKDEILELYLNENFYGNLSYGIEAAAETYFHTSAEKLNLAQSSFLAGLPQAPAVYDIATNRDETLRRHQAVLLLMYQLSKEQNCIYVSNNPKPICVDAVMAVDAADEIKGYNFEFSQGNMLYPHWVNYIRSELENEFDAQTIYRSGFTVYTTLDPELQDQAQATVANQVGQLSDKNVTDGALVAIQPSTGEILAMVGSADFYNDAISGQVNMAVSPRQPGSSIKPLTYVAAFEKGWTPSTLIWDVPTKFPASGNPDDTQIYEPVNYDGLFHGPVTVRTALANSFNIPAVKTLQYVGIFDDPNTPQEDGFINFAKRLGITTLTRDDYGLSLTLGGGDVSLLELTSAYATFANGGLRIPPASITKIVDYKGNVVFERGTPQAEQVIRAEHAFLISSILSDNSARALEFGTNSLLSLPFTAAAKTGTTNDFRDNWTLGYTPDVAVGVWVGNADYTPMQNTTGLTGAAPIWNQFMQAAIQKLAGGNPAPFVRPAGVVEKVICADSGTEPSQWCPSQRGEFFAADQLPLPKEDDLWQEVVVDSWTGLKESAYCSDFTRKVFALNVEDPDAVKWLKETSAGKDWLENEGFSGDVYFVPTRECEKDDPRPNILFAGISDGQTITTSPLDIYALVNATDDFKKYRLEYGVGDDPKDWKVLTESSKQNTQPERIYTWDLQGLKAGKVTLRIYLESTEDRFAERRIHLNLQVPTPTPTNTPTPTETPIPTETPLPTLTPTQTPTTPATKTPVPTLPVETSVPTSESTPG